MRFVLTGFCQDENIRRYSFQGIGAGRKDRSEFSVGVDVALLQRHGIPLQEAPLLCSTFLASLGERANDQSWILPDNEIRARAEQRASEHAQSQAKRKPAVLQLPTETPAPQASPDALARKPGVGLGSRPAYPWSSQARKSLLTSDPSQNS